MGRIEEPPRTFYVLTVVSSGISSSMNRHREPKIAGVTIVEKLINQSDHFKDAAKFNRQPMESFENRICLCVSVIVCNNPSKCVLDTLEFAYVETGQIPEQRVAIR